MKSSRRPAPVAVLLLAASITGAPSRAAAQAETLYGVESSAYFGSLLVVDRDTAAATAVGELGVSEPEGLDCAPDGTLWGSLGDIGGGEIVTIDRTTGAATSVGASGFSEVPALAVAQDGTIYASVSTGSGDTADGLATIDPSTGAATLVGGTYGAGITGMIGLAVSPAGVLYGLTNQVFGTPALYTIDPTTGLATFVALVEDEPGVPYSTPLLGIAFAADGTLFATTEYSSGYFAPSSGTSGGDLLRLDPATGEVLALVGASDAVVNALGFCPGAGGADVFAMLPDRGGNKGSIDAIIYHGMSLSAGASVELVRSGEPALVGDSVVVEPALHRITATFDLTGAAPGPRDVVVTDSTDPGNTGTLPEGFTVEDGSVVVLGIVPGAGGDTGPVTATIQARYVAPHASVKLVRGAEEIPGSLVAVDPGNPLFADAATVTARFDLRGEALGAWDVVVTNPADPGSPGVLAGGFTIESGERPEVSFQLVGPEVVRIGRPSLYTLTLRNEGNVDTTAVVAIFGVPDDALWEVQVPPTLLGSPAPEAEQEDTTEGSAILLPAMLLPPGLQRNGALTLRAISEGDFQIRAVLVQDP